jgi:3'-phosphoadenosine 5'-phosphosulfate sulfotransferase (PAPS reductase)/FAD synthetase
MKHIICYSGGHSSALVAIEVARKYGTADLVLLNHDINPSVEHADIKRFKHEVAGYLGVPITYANYAGWETMDQFDIALKHSAFKAGNNVICTHRLKTEPFHKWLAQNHPGGDCVIYYGFDRSETARVQRRSQLLAVQGPGYPSDYPLAVWTTRTIRSTREIGIEPPMTYALFKHANCVGCIKASRQHWYVVFCSRPDIWEKAKAAEEEIGYTIMKKESLADVEPLFGRMRAAGVIAEEKVPGQTFWAAVRKLGIYVEDQPEDVLPCECTENSCETP